MVQIKVQKLHANAKLPEYAHDTDAGMDIFSIETVGILPKSRVIISTGIAIELPPGYVCLVWDKSGLAFKQGITCLGGVIDAGYRGEYKICLYNTADEAYTINAGDKIAQILIQEVKHAQIVEVKKLEDSLRKTKGFGSSGK